MKNTIFIGSILVLMFAMNSNCVIAQFDVLKAKKEKITGTISGKTEKVTVNDGPPEYDPESDLYRAYSVVRDETSSTKHLLKDENWLKNVEGNNENAVGYIANAKKNLLVLQNDPIESKKSYVKDLAADLESTDALRQSRYDSFVADNLYDSKLESYYNFAILGWEISDESLEPSYSGYYAMKKDFELTRPEKYKDEYVQRRIANVDNFFKVEVYKIVPELNATVDGVIGEIHEKNSDGEESYLLNAKHYLKDFDEPLELIAYNHKFLLENKAGIDSVKAKIDKEKLILDEYVNSGKYDIHVAKHRQAILDAVRLSPSKTTNSNYSGMAKAGVTEGTVNRVVITSDIWVVKKNEWGFPLYKYLPVEIAVTIDGKCWVAYGHISKQYEGGGVYGSEYFDYWGRQEEMNCANINK
jgi:hypothetical protein